MDTHWLYLMVLLAGLVSGFINTLAGAGSLITIPLLIFMGLPANVANGTNRVGILLQSVTAVGGFKQMGVFAWGWGAWLAIPATIGAIAGACFAVNLNEEIMNRVIGALLLVMFVVVLLNPSSWLKPNSQDQKVKPTVLQAIIFFGIGFYGGFIQAGVGFFLLAGLVTGAGLDLVRANAMKVFITLVFTAFALMVFIYNNQVDYKLGITLGAGSVIGAWVASRMAVKRGAGFVRWILLGTLLVFSAKLLFF